MTDIGERSPFYSALRERIKSLGGAFNAHLHLDRAGTLDERYFASTGLRVLENSHISLQEKHHLISSIHAGPAYEKADLTQRVNDTLDIMVRTNTTYADTMVDVTDDEVGLTAINTLRDIRDARKDITLRLAAYSPLGYTDAEPARWRIYEEGARLADFLGCLPEADDVDTYPDHIGFEEQLVRVLDLARRLNLMVHVHTDQRNEARERGTERLIEVLRQHGGPVSGDGTPMVWAVHMISPSTYPEARHERMVEGLLECNIGVICCPSAAIGMRQLRPVSSPTYNSIPRILELAAAGVHVRLGSDNIADICSPSTTADLVDEVFVLSAAVRFYQLDVLARLAAGQRLSAAERDIVVRHLRKNDQEIDKVLNASFSAAF